ncbi:MAG TPA: DUF3443 family protein, partial [Vicinamibacterales bacterium]|nr:DUF3443 family protein [Vicinamibacterales bacterium]
FADSTIPGCTTAKGWFCPSTTQNLTATITGANSASIVINFTIQNAESLFSSTNLSAFPTLGGSNGGFTGLNASFDWGLPFFFGRPNFVLFENFSSGTVLGPASAF